MSTAGYLQKVADAEKAMGRKPIALTYLKWTTDHKRALAKAYVLRNTIPATYSTEMIKSRPAYFGGVGISKARAKQMVESYFPGLQLRSSYTDNIFRADPYIHLLQIYDLEGMIRKGEELSGLLIIAGMRHFGQYLQKDIWIFETPIKYVAGEAPPVALIPSMEVVMKERRLLFWVVQDTQHKQFCLLWYDQLHRSVCIVDTSSTVSTARDQKIWDYLNIHVNKVIQKGGLRPRTDQHIREVNVTRCPPGGDSGFLVIECFRMRLLESTEMINRHDEIAFTDWPNAGKLQNLPEETKLFRSVELHLRAYAQELGCSPDHLRWPVVPLEVFAVARKAYDSKGVPAPNITYAKDPSQYEYMDIDDDLEEYRGNKKSKFGSEQFRASQTPMSAQVSQRSYGSPFSGGFGSPMRSGPVYASIEEGQAMGRLSIGGGDFGSDRGSMGLFTRQSSIAASISNTGRRPAERSPSEMVAGRDDVQPVISPELSGPDQNQPVPAGRYSFRSRRLTASRVPIRPSLPLWDEHGNSAVRVTDTEFRPAVQQGWVGFGYAKEEEKWRKESDGVDQHNARLRDRGGD